jgi:hypothetical protein
MLPLSALPLQLQIHQEQQELLPSQVFNALNSQGCNPLLLYPPPPQNLMSTHK